MSGAPKYPIALEQLFFVRTCVTSVPAYDATTRADVRPQNTLNVVPIDGEPNRFHATMRTTMNPELATTFPYAIDVECMATLVSDGTLSSEEAHRGATINAHSALYGAIRESVAWLTGRHPYGTLMLGLSVLQGTQPEDPATQE
jgi:hypothetical protein